MKYKNILLCLFVFLATQAYAQVTINSGITPAAFSVVQVEGSDKGVRLPRMSAAEMLSIENTLKLDDKAIGLVVYNSSDNTIQFWDGSKWVSLSDQVDAENGITYTPATKVLELGGTLSKSSTTVDRGAYDLDFTHTASSTGEFSINNNKIKDGVVALNSEFYVMNGPYPRIYDSSVVLNTNNLTVNTESTGVYVFDEDGTSNINGKFRYNHSSLEEGYLLASDASGNATWKGLRPFGSVKEGTINNDVEFYTSKGEQIISNAPILLDAGQWMIFAKCTARANGSSAFMYHWLKLESSTTLNFATTVFEVISGVNPELVTTGTAYSCPNLVHFVDIKTPTYYRVKLGTSNNLGDKTVPDNGGSYFYAVRIDVATP